MTTDEAKWPFKMKRTQLPLSVCFAMTINKSPGQSLYKVDLYLAQQVFIHGQLYVVSSRVTLREGLKFLCTDSNLGDGSIVKNIVHPKVFNNV